MYDIMLSANSHSFIPSSATGFLLFFPYLIAEARNFMLNESGESWHTFLVPDCRRNDFSLSPLNMMVAVGLSCMTFMTLRYIPSTAALLAQQ